jgi:hypothetical protein
VQAVAKYVFFASRRGTPDLIFSQWLPMIADYPLGGAMSDIEPIVLRPAGADIIQPGISSPAARAGLVTFDRWELGQIFSVYGRHVADGEWRDYAIDMLRDRAVFSVFRRYSEAPLYRIEKNPKLGRRQGAYSVIAATGLILKRGHELRRVLKIFDRSRLTVVDAHV